MNSNMFQYALWLKRNALQIKWNQKDTNIMQLFPINKNYKVIWVCYTQYTHGKIKIQKKKLFYFLNK